MIRLTDELANEIKEAADKSLELYEDWHKLTEAELLDRRLANLEQLSQIGHFLPNKPLRSGLVDESLLMTLVRLAVIQTLLGREIPLTGPIGVV